MPGDRLARLPLAHDEVTALEGAALVAAEAHECAGLAGRGGDRLHLLEAVEHAAARRDPRSRQCLAEQTAHVVLAGDTWTDLTTDIAQSCVARVLLRDRVGIRP